MKLLPLLATAAAVASPALASLNLDIDLSISLDALTNSTLLAQALETPFDYVVVGGGNCECAPFVGETRRAKLDRHSRTRGGVAPRRGVEARPRPRGGLAPGWKH